VITLNSAAWEERLLLAKPGELYELPHIVEYPVKDARRTGRWEVTCALAKLLKDMGDPK
jgi:hypothetical protein